MRLQFCQLIAVRAMHGDPAPLGDKADDLVARDWLAAAGNMVHQVAYPFHHYPAIVLGAILRRVGFLLQLLQRGRILLGGHDLRTLPFAEIRSLISVVNQDTFLFHGTVEDNLRLARPDASRADIEQAARCRIVAAPEDGRPLAEEGEGLRRRDGDALAAGRLRQLRSGQNPSSNNLSFAYAGGRAGSGLSLPAGQLAM